MWPGKSCILSLTDWDLVTLNDFWSPADILTAPTCQFHLFSLQTTSSHMHSLLVKPVKMSPPKQLLCPRICSARDSDKTNHLKWTFRPCGPISKHICGIYTRLQQSQVFAWVQLCTDLFFFLLCVLRADVKVSVSPARRSSRYDKTDPPTDLQQGLFTLVLLWAEKPQCTCEKASATSV